MIICSYFTKNTPYAQVMKDFLEPSLKKFKLPYHIGEFEDMGNWSANTNIKSQFILDCLYKFKEAVCFIDADGYIEKYPELLYNLPKDFDIAFHLLNWYHLWRNQPENKSNMQLLSGTLALNYTDKSIKFLEKCIENIEKNPIQWEQKTMHQTLNNMPEMKINSLPFEYCCVVKQDYSVPKFCKNPVIIHTQASRKYKHRRNWK